jgi:hypothetical protein
VRVVGKPEVIQLDEKSRYRRSDSTFLPYTSQLAGYSEAEQYGTTRAGALAGSEVTVSSCVPPSIPEATISGYCQGVEYSGSVEHVFEWITMDGPAPNIEPGFARIEIIETIAIVHLEVQRWSGKLAGANARASDVFTLLRANGEWKITHKLFHWHDTDALM